MRMWRVLPLFAALILPACNDTTALGADPDNPNSNMLVAIADGSYKPLGDVGIGEAVLVFAGGTEHVRQVLTGEEATLLRIRTAAHTITLTGNSVVATISGNVRAKDLKPKDQVMTLSGPMAVMFAYTVAHNGKVTFLELEEPSLMNVGGVWVADASMERLYR